MRFLREIRRGASVKHRRPPLLRIEHLEQRQLMAIDTGVVHGDTLWQESTEKYGAVALVEQGGFVTVKVGEGQGLQSIAIPADVFNLRATAVFGDDWRQIVSQMSEEQILTTPKMQPYLEMLDEELARRGVLVPNPIENDDDLIALRQGLAFSPHPATPAGPAIASNSIQSGPEGSAINFVQENTTVNEEDGSITLYLSLSEPADTAFRVYYQTQAGSATGTSNATDPDYENTPHSGVTYLEFQAGDRGGAITVDLNGDDHLLPSNAEYKKHEEDETFDVVLTNDAIKYPQGGWTATSPPDGAEGAYRDERTTNTVTLIDNDDPIPTVDDPTWIVIRDAQIKESEASTKQLEFLVERIGAPADIYFKWETQDGSAVSSPSGVKDFESVAPAGSAPLMIPSSKTSVLLKVTVYDDSRVEFNEQLYAKLLTSGLVGAKLGRSRGTGTIIDDDDAYQIDEDQPTVCFCGCGCGDVQTSVGKGDGNVTAQAQETATNGMTFIGGSAGNDIVSFSAFLPAAEDMPGGELPLGLEARVTFNGVTQTVIYSGENWTTSAKTVFAFPIDTSSLPTGAYDWNVELVAKLPSTTVSRTYSGTRARVNHGDSLFGNGWFIDGWSQLYIDGAGNVTYAAGNGSAAQFKKTGANSFASPAGWYGELVKDGSTYTYTLPDGTQELFTKLSLYDVAILDSRTDLHGNTTEYHYESGVKLNYVQDSMGRQTHYEYDGNGYLESITDFANRTTEIEIVAGNLVSMTTEDPVNGDPAVYSFTYEGGQLKTLQRPEGAPVTFDYNHGKLSTITHHDPVTNTDYVETYGVTQTRGLVAETYGVITNPAPLLSVEDRQSFYTDELERTSFYDTDRFGNYTYWQDPEGAVTTYVRDAAGRVTQMTLPNPDSESEDPGPIYNYSYDNFGHLTELEYPDHSTEVWEYDDFLSTTTGITYQALVSYTNQQSKKTVYEIDPDTGEVESERHIIGVDDDINDSDPDIKTTFTYTSQGLLETVTDPLDRLTRYEYDGAWNDWVTSITRGEGGGYESTEQFEYDDAGNVNAYIDPLFRRTEFEYDVLDRLITMVQPNPDTGSLTVDELTWSYTYNGMDALLTTVDPEGNVTENVYGFRGRLMKVIESDPDTGLTRNTLTNAILAGAPVWNYEYDAVGNLTKVTDPLDQETEYVYDLANRVTKVIEADEDSGLTRNPSTGVILSTAPVWEYEYDGLGQLVLSKNPLGNATVYAYDELSQLTDAYPPKPTPSDALPHIQYVYDANQLTDVIDELGRKTHYEYDDMGRLAEVHEPNKTTGLPTGTHAVWTYGYDAAGNLTSIQDPDGNYTVYYYDDLNQLGGVTQADPSYGAGAVEFGYLRNAAGEVVGEYDPELNFTAYDYDYLGRLTTAESPRPDGPEGSATKPATHYTYDKVGNVTSTFNALGETTTYEYDKLYRLLTTTEEDSVDGNSVTQQAYNKLGLVTSVTDPKSNITSYVYDKLNRLATETTASGDRDYTYDKLGRTLTLVDRNGRGTKYGYDDLDRLTTEKWFTDNNFAGTVQRTITYEYDLGGQLVGANDPAADYDYHYNLAGDMDTVTQTIAGMGTVVGFGQTYDLMHRRSQYTTQRTQGLTTTNDIVTDYEYDALSRMTMVKQSNSSTYRRADIEYNNLGQFTEIRGSKDSAGATVVLKSTYAYDPVNRLIGLTHTNANGSTTYADYDMTYDAANRVHTFYSAIDSNTATYGYDKKGQLTSVVNSNVAFTGQNYGYDEAGNRDNASQDIDPENQLNEDATFTYDYDYEGNRTLRTRKSGTTDDHSTIYDWDNRNRLIGVTFKNNGGTVTKTISYEYDAFDRLVSRKIDADGPGVGVPQRMYFVYDGDNALFEFLDTDTTSANDAVLHRRNLWGPAVDQLLAFQDVSTWSVDWMLPDNLGSARDFVNINGAKTNHIRYDAFGNIASEWVTSNWNDSRVRYTGKYFDKEAGLQNNLHRWYEPSTGIWISQDPIGFEGGDYNLSRYVGNGPTNAIDSDGLAENPLGPTGHGGVKRSYQTVSPWHYYDEAVAAGEVNYFAQGVFGFVRIFFPPSEPNTVIEYNDGWTDIVDGGGPSNYAMGEGLAAMATFGGTAAGKGIGKAGIECVEEVAENTFEAATGLRRPYIRKQVRDEVYKHAPRDADGNILDPNTGEPIVGTPDLGHKPGHEFWREKAKAEKECLTQQQFNDRMNDPDLYYLEDPSSNRSHRFELRDDRKR